jgi:hypothetical protein
MRAPNLEESTMSKRSFAIFPALLATALASASVLASPPGTTLDEPQVRQLLAGEGFTRIDKLEFEDGMWETDATSADGKRVDVRVDPNTGKVYADGVVSRLSEQDIKARLTAAGYSKVHDLDFDDGIWEADAERADGSKVQLRVDPNDGRILGEEND